MAHGIYYVDDYSGTDFAKISAAIYDAHIAGGGTVALSNRTYTISQSIVLYSNIVFSGVGTSSNIRCTADVPIIQINRGNNDSSYIEIRDMAMTYASMTTTNSFHVEADRPIGLRIYGVFFYAVNRLYSGVLTWDATMGRTTPISASSEYSAFMTHIENCVFSSGSIWLNDSDSRIINNYIWANEDPNSLQYAIRLSNGSINISGNDIVPGNHSGVYLASSCASVRIENNYFDGSWDDQRKKNVQTGWGIYVEGTMQCIILGNTFSNIYRGGIKATNPFQLNISHNHFLELNRSGDPSTCYDVKIDGSSVLPSVGNIVEGNCHKREINGTKSYAVHIGNCATATVVNNSLIDWISGGSYHNPPFVVPVGKYSIRKDNQVTVFNVGTYPYQFDEGQVVVQHSALPQSVNILFAQDFTAQNIVPRIQDIHVNFIGSSATSAVVFSIHSVTALGFSIALRPVCLQQIVDDEPVCFNSTTDGFFFWRVSLQ